MITVRTGARLHLGFQNLALAHERLYGGVGLAIDEPGIELEVSPATDIVCEDPAVRPYVADAVEALGVPGAAVRVQRRYERHVGLGSGTQLALGSLAGIGRLYDRPIDVRTLAPALGRGGRSGVGVAIVERGGFVVDAGHPTERFTTTPPPNGEWTVPPPIVARPLPADWRFITVIPEAETGPSGPPEDERMRAVVERADAGIADEIATVLSRRLLPAVAECDHAAFGVAAARLSRLNGAWYADEQGGVYRPPAGQIVGVLDDVPGIHGAGQSSWGPMAYGVTHAERVEETLAATREGLEELALGTTVRAAAPRNRGVAID
jgi:beta-ribofuranosylaminobenzene 5'-phosphate synthase